MKSHAVEHPMSTAGEIFSHGATSQGDEKIAENPATAPVLTLATVGGVTLISKSNHTCPAVEKIQDAEFVADLQHLTKMQLRRKYPAEANSHRNMLTRSKRRGNKVHPALRQFRNFLQLVGPMPVSGATLDRIDNTDPEYAPGKVRWADKRTQNNNKSDTLTFYNSVTGETFTASRLAKIQKVAQSTIRQRRRRGWSDDEIIMGKRGTFSLAKPCAVKKDPFHSSNGIPKVNPCSKGTMASKSAAQIAFEREAELFAYCREANGEENLPAPYYVLNEECADLPGFQPITAEEEKGRFIKLWPQYRPHLIFENADPHHQRLIEEIDPEYVKRQREKAAGKAEATGLL